MTRQSLRNKQIPYNIGGDNGEGSFGWAVLGNDYKLLKNGNQRNLWGYSIFDKAESAAKRRTYRSTRRRYAKRKQRVHLLQDMLYEMVAEKDKNFFKKLKYSYLVETDRLEYEYLSHDYNLFDEKDLNDSTFKKEFPTIYHLRDYLCETKDKIDPRFIYLALHHIVKYRGNFLYEGQNISSLVGKQESITELEELFENYTENYGYSLDSECAEEFLNVFINGKTYGKDRIKEAQNQTTNKESKELLKEIANALCGYKFKTKVLFDNETEIDKLSFKDSDYLEKKETLENDVGDEIEIIEVLEKLYNYIVLKDILGENNTSISKCMISKYNDHKKDLKLLKEISKYNEKVKLFLKKNGTYDKYIDNPKEVSLDDVYKELLLIIDETSGKNEKEIIARIKQEKFLLRQNSTDNGSIPYQLHLAELTKIIDNQKQYYSCLQANEDKIKLLVSFRTPYYVGPYDDNKDNNKFSWLIRKGDSKEAIRPWNFEELVDIDETAKKFIDKMRNHCTYLLGEETLPKNSLLLNEFNVYNELNKITLNGNTFDVKTKERIVNELFRVKPDVKEKDLRKWLIDNQYVNGDDFILKGFQKEDGFASNLKMEISFRNIYGDEFEENKDNIEKIIEYLTVYDNKNIVKRRIKNERLCDDEVKVERILKINISGYGRFSKKLINGLVSNNINGKQDTILGHMKNDLNSPNFMQVLNNHSYDYLEQIQDNNGFKDDEITSDMVSKLPCSPALKRGIWQSIRVIKDIVRYMGHDPENIYLEFAREEGRKERTKSRYKNLEKIYKNHFANDKKIIDELKKSEGTISEEKVILYFMQNGKCLYSGKSLDIDNLSLYQVDHILPQCYLKDDSLSNKALVISSENQRKKDSLLLDAGIIEKQTNWWKYLLSIGLIDQKKFKNLTRTQVNKEDKERFVAKELVETRQICVHVRNILKNYYKNTNIGIVHAPLSSEFRKKYELYKVRSLNNCHHAQDAYLACMLGMFIDKNIPYFSSQNSVKYKDIKDKIEERIRNSSNYSKSEKNTYSYILDIFDTSVEFNSESGDVSWSGKEHISYLKKAFDYKDYFFSYQSRKKDGMLYKATLYKAGSTDAKISIKNNMDVTKYGGYKELQTSFIICFEHTKNNKTIKEFEKIPTMYMNMDLVEYLEKQGFINPRIIKEINIGQTFVENGSLYSFVSNGECHTLQPIILSRNNNKVLYLIEKNKLDNLLESDIDNLLNELVINIGNRIPKLSNKIEEFKQCVNENVNQEKKIEIIKSLISPLCGGSRVSIEVNGKRITDYGRLIQKITADNIQLLYTSPSGLFSTLTKL